MVFSVAHIINIVIIIISNNTHFQ